MNETQLVLDVWEAVRDHLAASKRTEVATDIMRAVFDYGFESEEVALVVDEDKDLAEAFWEVYHDGEHPADEEDEED